MDKTKQIKNFYVTMVNGQLVFSISSSTDDVVALIRAKAPPGTTLTINMIGYSALDSIKKIIDDYDNLTGNNIVSKGPNFEKSYIESKKSPSKQDKINSFIWNLQYAKDNFITIPKDKVLLEGIINRITVNK